jgi:hypothetical protein
MRHARLQCNRRLQAVGPNVGFLSRLTRRPTVRAVALLLTLELSGCYTYGAWKPLAWIGGPLPDRLRVRAPIPNAFPPVQEVDLLHPWMDSDSVLVGSQSVRGLRDDGRLPILRLPAGEVEVAGPRVFSPGRTVALALALGACGWIAWLATVGSPSCYCPPGRCPAGACNPSVKPGVLLGGL